jgi:uncharacterized protein YbaR (Trm112 family)
MDCITPNCNGKIKVHVDIIESRTILPDEKGKFDPHEYEYWCYGEIEEERGYCSKCGRQYEVRDNKVVIK